MLTLNEDGRLEKFIERKGLKCFNKNLSFHGSFRYLKLIYSGFSVVMSLVQQH